MLILLGAGAALAQTHRGSVRGTVYDPQKAAVAGATLTVTEKDTGETRTVTSGAQGEYVISSLRPGNYRLTVSALGFAATPNEFTLAVNQDARLDIDLDIAGPTGSPQFIYAGPEVLKKDSAAQGTVIDNRQVEGLPLDGRNFFELALLVPGAVPPAQGSAGSVRGDFAFSVNGAREDSNNFLLDGVYNVDPKLNTFGVRPPVDAIREFEILTSTYDASFGRNAGRASQRRSEVRLERFSRLALRVSSQWRVGCAKSLSCPRTSRHQNTSATSLAVRSAGRSEGQNFFLWRLRRHALA